MILPVINQALGFHFAQGRGESVFPFGKIFTNSHFFNLDFPVRESYTKVMKISSALSISEAVKNRRKQLGLTQVETAAMCNVGARFFSELENGKETLQINKVLHCLEMLGINLYAVNREDDSIESGVNR